MISKEKLVELYIDKRLTTYEIAEIYNVNRCTICRLLKQYGIEVNHSQRKYEIIKRVPLTKEQREMIVGTLLGDGHMALHGRKNKSCRLMIGHCEAQKDLVMWKKQVLGNFVNVVNRRVDGRDGTVMLCFNTVTHNEFAQFRKLFYDSAGKKVITRDIISYVTPLSIAVWLMDDGTRNKNVNIRFATDGFSLAENQILQEMLYVKFDIRSKVCEYTRHDKKFYYLSLNKENSIKLSNLIRDYVIDSMKYKIINPISSTTLCQTPDVGDDKV